jgi:hypothetical protein
VSDLDHLARFALHFHRCPEQLGADDVRRYQLHLINDKRLAPTSVVGAVAALGFLYQITLKQPWAADGIIPRQPSGLRVIGSRWV